MEAELERSLREGKPGEEPPGPAPLRPAPYWSSCGRRNAAVAWTPVPTLRRPLRHSAPPALPVPSLTDAAPGGSPDPRPGRGRCAGRGVPSGREERNVRSSSTQGEPQGCWGPRSRPHPGALPRDHPAPPPASCGSLPTPRAPSRPGSVLPLSPGVR